MIKHDYGIITNEQCLNDFLNSKNKLFVISGSSRGGTSLIAYALRKAGVEFGHVDANNHEPRALLDNPPTKETIEEYINGLRPTEGSVGVKFPAFVFHLPWMDTALSDVLFIHVIRNHLDTANTIMQRDPSHSFDIKNLSVGIKHSARFHNAFADALPDMTSPVFAVSYEKIINKPVGFVESLRELGISMSDQQVSEIAEAIGTPGYKQV